MQCTDSSPSKYIYSMCIESAGGTASKSLSALPPLISWVINRIQGGRMIPSQIRQVRFYDSWLMGRYTGCIYTTQYWYLQIPPCTPRRWKWSNDGTWKNWYTLYVNDSSESLWITFLLFYIYFFAANKTETQEVGRKWRDTTHNITYIFVLPSDNVQTR